MRKTIAALSLLLAVSKANAATYLQIGDSTGVVGFPDHLVVQLRAATPGDTWVTLATLGRPAGKHSTWDTPTDVRNALNANPTADCVIILGINDRFYFDTARQAAAEVMQLARICEDEKQRTAYVVTPFPATDTADKRGFLADLTAELVAQGRAQGIAVLDTSQVWWTRDWETCGVTTCDGPGDGVHPYCLACRQDFADLIGAWLP